MMNNPVPESVFRQVDADTIDNEINGHIGTIQTLLKKKQDMIVEARALVLKELNEEREALQNSKERIMSQIDRERKNLAAERETLNYFKQRLFESDRPDDAIVSLNVGGEKISSMQGTLTSCPGSTLSAMFSGTEFPGTRDKDGCCFIDRNPKFFRMILEFLRANVVPEMDNPQEEVAFRKEVDYFGLSNWIYPPKHIPPILRKLDSEDGRVRWQFRCDVNEIKKDGFYTSPDFLHTGDRWRMLFTERCSFLSVYLHNIDAGLMAANWEGLPTVLTMTLKNTDDRKTTAKTIRHTFTRRSPDIGLNYFMLMEGLRANKGGFLVTSQPQSREEEAKPEIIFELVIEKPIDSYMGQPVDATKISGAPAVKALAEAGNRLSTTASPMASPLSAPASPKARPASVGAGSLRPSDARSRASVKVSNSPKAPPRRFSSPHDKTKASPASRRGSVPGSVSVRSSVVR